MSRYLLGIIVGLSIGGCAGKNTVAGADKTKAEQLESTVVSWCKNTCERFNDCATAGCNCQGDTCECTGVDAGCAKECEAEMARFTKGDDSCAERGEKFKSCIDALTCDDFNGNGAKKCGLTKAEESACPESDTPSEPAPSAGGGPVVDPTGGTGTGGTGSGGATGGDAAGPSTGGVAAGPSTGGAAAAPSTGGSTSTGPVTCHSAYGAAGAASDAPAPTPAAVCEEGRGDCSDNHEYSWLCATGSEGQIGCACFVDKQVTGGFDPQSSSCPTLETVNAGCSWNLTY